MNKQFDSLSYDELTSCVNARVIWIREYNRFLGDRTSEGFKHVRTVIAIKRLREKNEIKRLLKMRRVLKRSHLKYWDSDKLSI